ncbi:MAG TPA: serine hydrolase domain-containing protein, partial [Anaerolineales bacterium]|nr:serine hydrolase domain-containing protein [Anaerolineales bacterium]
MTLPFADQLHDLLLSKSRDEQFSGVVLLQRDDGELFKQAYGFANRSWNISNAVDTRFRIASISKMFTAAAVLQLVEAGTLSLDTRVVECLGLENTTIPVEATVWHMLTMTSGIADWFEESGNWEETWAALCREHPIYLFRRNADYLPLFVNKAPLFPVGERHQYNGAGYILLGLVIEKLSGISYFDYVRQHIFKRAGMTHSDFLALDDVHAAVAEGYIPIHGAADKITGWKKNI